MGSAKSNIVQAIFAPAANFQLIAGVSSGIATGYIDQDAAGYIFDIGVCGSIVPSNAPVNGHVIAAMGYLNISSKYFFLVLVNAPTNLPWRVTFTDNHGVVQSYSSLQGVGALTPFPGGFLTAWQFSIPDSYVPMTNGVTYLVTPSNTP